MLRTLLSITLISLLSAAVTGQPQYGDLVVSVGSRYMNSGYTAYLDPSKPGTLTTLASAQHCSIHNWVRMAPNNTDLVATQCR